MVASGVVSIPSAVGTSTVLTVTGDQTLAYAQLLQAYLDDAIAAKTLNISQGVASSSTTTTFASPITGAVNEAVVSSNEDLGIGIGTTATIPLGYQAVFDNVNGPSTVIGADSNTDAIFAGLGASATYEDHGGDNLIIFVDGSNTYIGDNYTTATSDTIAGGIGFDTITTGHGMAVVYAGVGQSLITTNDAGLPTSSNTNADFNSYVYLAEGVSTVNADGLKDAVIASVPGQLINTGDSNIDYTDVILVPSPAPYGDETVHAGSGLTAVFDFSNANSVTGGAGLLLFMGGVDVQASVVGGSGIEHLFGAAGDTISWTAAEHSGANIFVAGAGNETLNAVGSEGNLAIFAYNTTVPAVGAPIRESLAGGTGNDTLVSGEGNETLFGGAGANEFLINAPIDGAGANITLADFGASPDNVITFNGFTTSEIQSALAGAHTVTGANDQINTVFTLSDNTTVTVVGISSLTGHTYYG